MMKSLVAVGLSLVALLIGNEIGARVELLGFVGILVAIAVFYTAYAFWDLSRDDARPDKRQDRDER